MRTILASVVIGLITIGSAFAIEIEVARSRDVDYSAYRSFAFKAKEGLPADHPLGENSHLLEQVREAAKKTLLKRGMTLIEGDEPDVWITFYGLGREDLSIEGTSKDLGAITWVGAPGAHSSRTVVHATLVVEVHDSDSDERIWSGWATGSSISREKLRARAGKVTRKILEEFPRE